MTRTTATLAATIACGALAAAAQAQDLIPKAPPQTEPVTITGVTIHTVSGDTIEDGTLAFEDGRFTTIRSGEPRRRRGRVVDLSGRDCHAWPGMIAPNTELGLVEIGSIRDTQDARELGDFAPEVRAAVAVNPDSTAIPVARANGILLAGAFPSGGTVPRRSSVITLDGWTADDMTVLDVAGLVIDWPRMRPFDSPFVRASAAEQKRQIEENVAEIDDFFSDAEAYRRAREADPDYPTDLLLEATLDHLPDSLDGEPAKPVHILANSVDEITSSVDWALDKGMNPIIVGGAEAFLCADTLAERDIPVILRGLHAQPRREDAAYDESYTMPARLKQAGVRFCIESSEETPHIRGLPYEAAMAARHGARLDPPFTTEDAVRAITLSTAEILGIDDNYGSIENGKSATFFITDGHVLDVRSRVLHAFIDGREIDLTSKHTQLRDKYIEKYEQLDLLDR